MRICCEDQEALNRSLEASQQRFEDLQRYPEVQFSAQAGSFLARSIDQYKALIQSGYALDGLAYTQAVKGDKATVVDSGCGTGYALTGIRTQLPNARLIGLDAMNYDNWQLVLGTNNSLSVSTNVAEMLIKHKIEFIHGDFANINKLIPNGYNYLVSVGAFYDQDEDLQFQSHLLRAYYRGLSSSGVAQVVATFGDSGRLSQLQECLDHNSIPALYNTIPQDALRESFFKGTNGTVITLGPKPE